MTTITTMFGLECLMREAVREAYASLMDGEDGGDPTDWIQDIVLDVVPVETAMLINVMQSDFTVAHEEVYVVKEGVTINGLMEQILDRRLFAIANNEAMKLRHEIRTRSAT